MGKILFYFRGNLIFWGHFFQFGAILRLGNLKALFWGQIFLFRGIFKIYEEAGFFTKGYIFVGANVGALSKKQANQFCFCFKIDIFQNLVFLNLISLMGNAGHLS